MIHDDYILRQVRQLTEALTRVLFLRQAGRVDVAILEIENTGRLIGARSGTSLVHMKNEDVLGLVTTRDGLHVESAFCLFDLLAQASDLYETEDRYEERDRSAEHAIEIALAIDETQTSSGRIRHHNQVDRLVRTCGLDHLEDNTVENLMGLFERYGAYGRAEDMLFLLAERRVEHVEEIGLLFFDRLEQITPSQLRKGNLSLKEVADGRRQFRALLGLPTSAKR